MFVLSTQLCCIGFIGGTTNNTRLQPQTAVPRPCFDRNDSLATLVAGHGALLSMEEAYKTGMSTELEETIPAADAGACLLSTPMPFSFALAADEPGGMQAAAVLLGRQNMSCHGAVYHRFHAVADCNSHFRLVC